MGMTLREWRKKEGLTQKQAGKKLDICYISISKWETQEIPTISGKQIIKIFIGTKGKVTPNDLFGITKEKTNAAANNQAN